MINEYWQLHQKNYEFTMNESLLCRKRYSISGGQNFLNMSEILHKYPSGIMCHEFHQKDLDDED